MKRQMPLSITECRKIVSADDCKEKSLALLILTTGIHPSCISEWKRYNLQYTKDTIIWKRTKTEKQVMVSWRAPMREMKRYKSLVYWKKKTRQWMHNRLKAWGEEIGISGLCPLLLRRGYFVNRGRLGHSQMLIETEARTKWETIINYYAFGLNESGMMKDKDKEFLQWMYEK